MSSTKNEYFIVAKGSNELLGHASTREEARDEKRELSGSGVESYIIHHKYQLVEAKVVR